MSTDDSRNAADAGDVVYKTKIVEFLGRSTPIILQNGNGPCPLLSICNVLLLRNNLSLNLSEDVPEVSLQRLLSIVAEKLIDSNSNVQGKDDDYVTNQEQNIADAIDLLPRLATGIDVNVQFKRIDDFEFTRECAIFDLFDIGLYHGWIVDPQDTDTAAAIGTKSYNSLVGELVTFDTRKLEGENKSILEEDYVDFAAATTATLGVPSPSLSRGRSFDDCPVPVPVDQLGGRGDIEEAVELRRVMDLSIAETSSPVDMSISSAADSSKCSLSSNEITDLKSFGSVVYIGSLVAPVEDQPEKSNNSPLVEYQESSALNDCKVDGLYSKAFLTEFNSRSPSIAAGNKNSQPVSEGSAESFSHNDTVENYMSDRPILNQATSCQSTDEDDLRTDMLMLNLETTYKPTSEDYSDRGNSLNGPKYAVGEYQSVLEPCSEGFSEPHIHHIPPVNLIHSDSSSPVGLCENFHSSTGTKDLPAIAEVASISEPIYEGEEKMLDSGHPVYEGQEPVYEGEAVLAEQADKVENDTCSGNPKHVTQQQWQLIKNFLDSSASQLTIYGLFCLQEGLKERELCVFFRNNHFSTMFKFEGQLYLLATDQGYITQPDLVWEKLNEVNGDTVFMTGNFKEFKADDQVSGSWNEQNAMTTTTDYLATLEGSSPSRSDVNSDLQLAIALQQQEFEQQPQRNQQQPLHHKQQGQQQSSLPSRSRLVTGPQGPRNSNASQKNEKKEKCVVM